MSVTGSKPTEPRDVLEEAVGEGTCQFPVEGRHTEEVCRREEKCTGVRRSALKRRQACRCQEERAYARARDRTRNDLVGEEGFF